jgi:hypothetical protein
MQAAAVSGAIMCAKQGSRRRITSTVTKGQASFAGAGYCRCLTPHPVLRLIQDAESH